MAQVSFSQIMHAEQTGDVNTSACGKNQGTLKTEGKNYEVIVFTDSAPVTEDVAEFLQQINQRSTEQSLDFEVVHFTQEMIEIENEIGELLKDLVKTEPKEGGKLASLPRDNKTEHPSAQTGGSRTTRKGNRRSPTKRMGPPRSSILRCFR